MSEDKNSPIINNEENEVQFYLPAKVVSKDTQAALNELIYLHPSKRKYLDYKSFEDIFQPDHKKHALLSFAKKNKLKANYSQEKRHISLKVKPEEIIKKAPDTVLSKMKELQLAKNKLSAGSAKKTTDKTTDPGELLNGFVKTHRASRPGMTKTLQEKNISTSGISAIELASLYNFPEGDGTGECVGIMELGGKFDPKDLAAYFKSMDMDVPEIEIVGTPSKTPYNENLEVTADIEVLGALVPKAKLVIYYGTSLLDAMRVILADSKNTPSVVSISWALSELQCSPTELSALNDACYEASLRGITLVAASGDNGAYNQMQYPNVNTPANLSWVLGCGGTQIQVQNKEDYYQWVWNETGNLGPTIGSGGGFSQKISSPEFQIQATTKYLSLYPQFKTYNPYNGRPVPDVSADAASASGYSIYFSGKWMPIGGTSLATPLWAALITRLNQNLNYRLGFINQIMYKLAGSAAFTQITQGNNGLYLGATYWNPATGLGTSNGKALLEEIKNLE